MFSFVIKIEFIIIRINNFINYNNKLMALKRLAKEYKEITKNPTYNYSVETTDNFLVWNFIIIGPSDTIYEGGLFKGVIEFNQKYPISAPVVKFNNIIHPNIYID